MLDKGLKQRMVGALVLVALAVIFLPMLLSRENDQRRVVVDVPPAPQAQSFEETVVVPVEVAQPIAIEEPEPEPEAVQPVQPLVAEKKPDTPAPVRNQPQESRLDANSLPISWSVQLASLSSRSGAESLQQKLRAQGYNAYIRTFDGMNRVFVGPVIERAEAERLREQINRQHKLSGFIVRFKPESA